ncbi:MAG: hypothetical protein HUU45_06400, partial [Leptospiraceae bacterium]|nr:hypothetical protein [Leptospiraceae bacterium]
MTKMKNSQKSKSKKSTKANDKKLNAKWSKTIQNLTQEVFTDLRIESFFRGFCVLKSDSGFGRITIEDAMND